MNGQDADSYGTVAVQVEQVSYKLQSAIFTAAQDILNSTLFTVILAITACIYVYNKIGQEWNREDMYKIGSWIFMYSFLKVIFMNYQNYIGFLDIVNTPLEWIYGVIRNATASMGFKSIDMSSTTSTLITMIGKTLTDAWEQFNMLKGSSYTTAFIALIMAAFLLFFILYIGIFTIIIKFFMVLILAMCPFVLPVLIIKPIRGYFFSWLKLYMTYAICLPMAMLVIGLVISAQSTILSIDTTNQDLDVFIARICAGLMITILGIVAIGQIPTFAQQIMGAAVSGISTGAGEVTRQTAGRIMEGYTQARAGTNYNTGQQNSVGRSIASAVTGAMPFMGGIGQRIAGQDYKSEQRYYQREGGGNAGAGAGNSHFGTKPTPHINPSQTNQNNNPISPKQNINTGNNKNISGIGNKKGGFTGKKGGKIK